MSTQTAEQHFPLEITPDTTANKAARFMLDHHLDMVKVTANGKTVGVLTRAHLLEIIASGIPPETKVDTLMNRDPEFAQYADDLESFASELQREIPTIPGEGWKDRVLYYFQRQIKRERKTWRAYLDGVYNPIVGVDKYGRINIFNKASSKVTGVEQKQAYGKDIREIFNNSQLTNIVRSGQTELLRRIDTVGKTFLSSRSPVVVDNEIVGAVAVLQETSDLEKVVQELESTRQLNRQLDAIIESSFDGLYICDGQGVTMRINKSFERILGVTAAEVVGRNMADLVAEGVFSRSGTLLALKRRETVTIPLTSRIGKTALVTSVPIFDNDGNIVMVVTNVRDMTELIELEKRLERVEDRRQKELNAVFESSFDGLYICDGEGNTLRINKAFERIMGVTAEEVVGRNMADLVAEGVFSRSGTLLALQRRERVTIPLQSKIGKKALVTSTPIFDDQSNIVLVVTNVRDMTELMELERRLEHAEDRRQRELAAVFESSFDGLYISDGEGNTLRINKAFERILGVKAEDIVGRNMADLVREGVFSRSGTLLALQRREQVTIPLEANTGKTALVTSTPIFDDSGNIVLVVTNVRDMTELNELHVKVEHLEGLSRFYQAELTHLKLQNRRNCIAHSRKMRELLQMITHVASVDSTVLIQGESGVGKEVIADVLHSYSNRKDHPFIKVNCGAIPANLLESELFGYEPGAFTGASKSGKAGMFELADKGTLFLDEISEMPLDLQVKLLRVLQDKQVFRVGGSRPISVDTRILAGTNRNLQQMVTAGQFRQDLYYRLNVIPVYVPPLRERREDIPVLSKYFLDYYNRKHQMSKVLSSDAIKPLLLYDWPGNIRELENLIERLVVTNLHDTITADDVHSCLELTSIQGEVDTDLMPLPEAIEQTERRLLQKAFSLHNSTYKVAKVLGISQPSVVRKAAKYGIKESGR
ncbi:MAG: sigma 54-interacting transcriptional regulator [Syntrophomonadaceae bacterium]|nr:sigma 54-interacting transcriptional regulator [Syntrophomonadaceae bacterium]